MDWADLADALHLALGDVDAKLRAEYPELFARVDEIKARPQRHGHRQMPGYTGPVYDCAWCGADFATFWHADRICCSRECLNAYRKWRRARGT